VEGRSTRRPDILIFINGLPIALMELKNPADENATIWSAFRQIQTYKDQIPALFTYNELLIISDGMEARVGSLTATERFMPWRTIELQVVIGIAVPTVGAITHFWTMGSNLDHFAEFRGLTGDLLARALAVRAKQIGWCHCGELYPQDS